METVWTWFALAGLAIMAAFAFLAQNAKEEAAGDTINYRAATNSPNIGPYEPSTEPVSFQSGVRKPDKG